MICDADKVSIRYNKMRKKNRHGRQAADRMELQHATFERSLRTMSEKIVTLNEEVIKGQIKERYCQELCAKSLQAAERSVVMQWRDR